MPLTQSLQKSSLDFNSPDFIKLTPYENGLVRDEGYQTKISESQVGLIVNNYPLYKEAADKAGIPWQMLAAIHFRENDLKNSTQRVGGAFQFDGSGAPISTTFKDDLLKAAKFLQEKVSNNLTSNCNDEHLIKDAFYGYNGRSYGSYDQSPYVMNNFDLYHQNMRLKGTLPDTFDQDKDGNKTERIKVDVLDKRLGAFTFYTELKKVFPDA